MSGYQEILTDPSYKHQIVTMTYPMIGNYGITEDDVESTAIQVSGFVVKEYSKTYSNYRANPWHLFKTTRHRGNRRHRYTSLTQHIRDQGAMRSILSQQIFQKAFEKGSRFTQMAGLDLAQTVTTLQPTPSWRNKSISACIR